jgi:hypothetical protein
VETSIKLKFYGVLSGWSISLCKIALHSFHELIAWFGFIFVEKLFRVSFIALQLFYAQARKTWCVGE